MTDGEEQTGVDYANLIRAQTRQVDIDRFKERGMRKVNVINAKKINELISQAVTNIIGRMEEADIQTIKEDKAQIVMDSMTEFKRLFDEQRKEHDAKLQLQDEISQLREALNQRADSAAASETGAAEASASIKEEIAQLRAMLVNQAARDNSEVMRRKAMVEEQIHLINERFDEIKDSLGGGANGSGGDASVLTALKDLQGAIEGRFEELTRTLREAVGSGASADLKAELSALRRDLEQKTVAAETASTAALQAQLTQVQELLAKGGGGGFSGDIGDVVSKLEGSLSRKLAEAGIGKQDVSEVDAVAASGVMLGAAFKGLDDIETNLDGMSARKQVDKKGAAKAKGALDALKKLKGGGKKE
jgi:hypothetical protein